MFSPRDDVHDQAAREPDVPRVLQPRLPLAVGDQQPHQLDHLPAAEPRLPLGGPSIYLLPVHVVGNTDLKEQSLDAFEVGYSGVVGDGRAIVSAAFYLNWLKNDILFTQPPGGVYTAANPPSNWPLPPDLHRRPGPAGRVPPSRFTYLNFGKSTSQGLELGVNAFVNQYVIVFANYSYQSEPDPKDFDSPS